MLSGKRRCSWSDLYYRFDCTFHTILWDLSAAEGRNWIWNSILQYIPRNMHTVFALLCFVVVIHWLIFPYPPGLLRWHCGNLTIAPVPAKQPWWIWINTSGEIIMNGYITTTKQSTTIPCAYFLGYAVDISRCHQLAIPKSVSNIIAMAVTV